MNLCRDKKTKTKYKSLSLENWNETLVDRQTLEEHEPSLSSCFRSPPPFLHTRAHTHVNTGPESAGKSGSAELRLEHWNKWMEVEWGRFFSCAQTQSLQSVWLELRFEGTSWKNVWLWQKIGPIYLQDTRKGSGLVPHSVCVVFDAAWTRLWLEMCFSVNMVPSGPSSCSLTFLHV